MENTINQRIDNLIAALNKNHKTFAESIGKAPTIIYNIVNGRNKPGYELLELICEKYPNVSRDWIIMGEGDIFREPKESSRPDGYLQEHLIKLEDNFRRLNQQIEVKDQQIAAKDKQLSAKDKQIEQLLGLLGKPECATETGVIKHPATGGMFLETLGQRA